MVCDGVKGNNVMTKLIVDNCYHVVLHLIVLTLTDKVGLQQPVGYSVSNNTNNRDFQVRRERAESTDCQSVTIFSGWCYKVKNAPEHCCDSGHILYVSVLS